MLLQRDAKPRRLAGAFHSRLRALIGPATPSSGAAGNAGEASPARPAAPPALRPFLADQGPLRTAAPDGKLPGDADSKLLTLTLFPYTTLFRSAREAPRFRVSLEEHPQAVPGPAVRGRQIGRAHV